MSKINNDKYYTPISLANHCIDRVLRVIGVENISEIIEPSVGSGSFLHHPKMLIHFGYDIEPECTDDMCIIQKCDYLEMDVTYLPGRLIIGNPPYGRCLNLAQRFYKKAVEQGDYIAFILPISQLNNSQFLYEFDLIYSEDLGKQKYTDRELHCCFNIYRRPQDCEVNPKPKTKLNDITIYRQDCNGYKDKDYDLRMCYWGDGTAGKILSENEHYSGEYKIKINNEKLKRKIISVVSNYDWKRYIKGIAMRRIKQYHIIDVLCKEIPEIE